MDRKQLTSVFVGLRQRLRTVALGVVDEQEVDDALQEAFCRLWMRSDNISDQKAAEGISVVTVRHVAIDERRRQTAHPQGSLDENVEGIVHRKNDLLERFEEVRRLIFRQLDERQADILWKRDYQEWDFKEIAEEYETTEANIRKIVSRARKEIREIYRRQHEDR